VVGLILVALAAVGTARLLDEAGRTVEVYAAAVDLAPGARPAAGDLRAVPVRLDAPTAQRYVVVGAASGVEGLGVLRRGVAAGELIPASALAVDAQRDTRLVPVPVDAERARTLVRGAAVDVYITPRSSSGNEGPTARLLQGAVIRTIDRGDTRFGGGAAVVAVVLEVPADAVAALVSGTRRGDVDLVAVDPSMGLA
jgi:hypothetical protein